MIAVIVDRHHTPAWLRLGLAVGVLGGYTTFSASAEKGGGLDQAFNSREKGSDTPPQLVSSFD